MFYKLYLNSDEIAALEFLVELGRQKQGDGYLSDDLDDALVSLNDKLAQITEAANNAST